MSEKEARAAEMRDIYQASMNRITMLEDEMEAYSRKNVDINLVRTERDLKKAEEIMRIKAEEFQALDSKIQAMQRGLTEGKIILRNISDNLKYRTMVRDIATLETSLAEKKGTLETFDRNSFDKQMANLRKRHDSLSIEHAGLVGEKKQMELQAAAMASEIEEDYKDVAEQYNCCMIKLRVSVPFRD